MRKLTSLPAFFTCKVALLRILPNRLYYTILQTSFSAACQNRTEIKTKLLRNYAHFVKCLKFFAALRNYRVVVLFERSSRRYGISVTIKTPCTFQGRERERESNKSILITVRIYDLLQNVLLEINSQPIFHVRASNVDRLRQWRSI